MKNDFSVDWTSSLAPTWTQYLNPMFSGKKTRMLEIGVYEGRTAMWFLDNILNHHESTYTGIDPYEYSNRNEIKYNMSNARRLMEKSLAGYGDKAAVWLDASEKCLPLMINREAPQFDLVRVDGCHQARNVLFDIVLGWRLLKTGGVMLIDDYDPSGATAAKENWGTDCPQTAADAYFKCICENDWELLYEVYEMGVIKRR